MAHVKGVKGTRARVQGTRIQGTRIPLIAFPTTTFRTMSRVEQLSFERMSLGWAWHDTNNAIALACELLDWGVADLTLEPPEAVAARAEVDGIVAMLRAHLAGQPVTVPADFETYNDHPMTRLYWYAQTAGTRIVETAERAARVLQVSRSTDDCVRWRAVGQAAQAATEFLRKIATSNPTVGAVDGAAGGILNKIGHALLSAQDSPEIVGRMFNWRVRDALRGKTLDPELEANLRPAFEAAWSAGEYSFAYSLLDNLDTLAE